MNPMRLVNVSRETLAAAIEREAERDAMALRRASMMRLRPHVRRRDSRQRVRPRLAV